MKKKKKTWQWRKGDCVEITTVCGQNHKKERLRQKVLSLLTHIDKCIDTEALNNTENLLERAMLVLQTDYTCTSQPFPSTQ